MPTAFYDSNFRFYFFLKEENRKHVHVASPNGELKVWLEPQVVEAKRIHLSDEEAKKIIKIAQERKEKLIHAWNSHFGENKD